MAREAGALMVEFDVQQSVDGELFLFHDETLERLCGESVQVASLRWEELSRRVVGRWQDQALTMPRLTDVFASLQRSIFYNVELKTDTVPYPGIEARLAILIRAHGLAERVLVSSFRHESLQVVRQSDPHVPLGLLVSVEQARRLNSPAAIVARAQEFACFSVHPDFRTLRHWPELGAACHAAGLRVFPWTADSPDDWKFLVDDVHVDGIITNDPGALYEWLLGRSQPGD
jgi:glycerophosphoryl diester phosphodiesterase